MSPSLARLHADRVAQAEYEQEAPGPQDLPVTEHEIDAAAGDYYPDTPSEMKPADFGRIAGQVLALDYGLHEAIEVKKRRAYYADLATSWKSRP